MNYKSFMYVLFFFFLYSCCLLLTLLTEPSLVTNKYSQVKQINHWPLLDTYSPPPLSREVGGMLPYQSSEVTIGHCIDYSS